MSDHHHNDTQQILELLRQLNDLIEHLPANRSAFPAIESDLVLETLRKLYLEFLPVRTFDAAAVSPVKPVVSVSTALPDAASKKEERVESMEAKDIRKAFINTLYQQPNTTEEPIQELEEANTSRVGESDVTISPSLFAEEVSAAAAEIKAAEFHSEKAAHAETPAPKAIGKKILEDRIQQIKASSLFEEPKTLADQYEATETIGDKITRARTTQSIGEKIKEQPLEDLKNSIGINERYAFIHELFNGNTQLYQQCIERLNGLLLFEDAAQLIDETLATIGGQELNRDRRQQFEALIKRRFKA